MTRNHSGSSDAKVASGADDFKLIRGIGRSVESRLHNAGILTFEQLAARMPDEVAELVSDLVGMSAEHIVKQDWIGQARKLASKRVTPRPHKDALAPQGRQHLATFTVDLLLDEENNVHHTHVVHVQSGDEGTRAGWEEGWLVSFLIQRAALHLPHVEPVPPVTATAEPVPPVAAMAEPVPPVTATAERPSPPATTTSLAGEMHLLDFEIVPADANIPPNILRYGQPLALRLTLDLTDVAAPHDSLISYTVTLYARPLGGGPRQIVGEAHDFITLADKITVDVKGIALPQGVYRLEALVSLTSPGMESVPRHGLRAMLQGDLLQVS